VRIDARPAGHGDEMLTRIKEIFRGYFPIVHTSLQVASPHDRHVRGVHS
jgi:hypothetical protein